MSLTTHIGYGPFQLQDLLAGEFFARSDSSLARVCDSQPPGRPDHILIWTNYNTSNAQRIYLHRTALVYELSEEKADRKSVV